MKKALLIIETDAHFTELFRVACAMKSSGKYRPTFYWAYPPQQRDISLCEAQGFAVPSVPQGHGSPRISTRLRRLLPAATANFIRLIRAVHVLARTIRGARKYLKVHGFELLVLAEDNAAYSSAEWIEAGHSLGIPSVIVPFTVANAIEPAQALLNNPAHRVSGLCGKLVAALYPNWIYEHGGRRLVRLPPPRALARQWLGLAPPLPWIINSGKADAIAVESEFMLDYYRREGLPEGQLVLCGALYDDILADQLANAVARRQQLHGRLGLDPGRKLVLCAMPPDQLAVAGDRCDFRRYRELVKFWAETLAQLRGCNVVVRAHPRTRLEEIEFIRPLGLTIVEDDTASLVPLCDIYVASVSATIRWAIACGKPVVNYDVYRYRYVDYDQ